MNPLKLVRQQLDAQFKAWQVVRKRQEPKDGWLKTIRTALGMTTYQLAERMGVNQSRVMKLEASVRDHTIKLQTLERVADALECDLVFALVPKTSLGDMVTAQAKRLAKKRIGYVSHSMGLEQQSVDQRALKEDVEALTTQLLNGPANKLWSQE